MSEITESVLKETVPTSITSLIDAYRVKEEVYTITLPGGEVLKAKTLPDSSAWTKLKDYARLQVRICQKGPMPDWTPFLPASPEVIASAVICEALLVEPKMTFVEGLRMGKECGMLLTAIADEIGRHAVAQAETLEAQEVTDRKNDSRQTASVTTEALSAETCTDAAPMN